MILACLPNEIGELWGKISFQKHFKLCGIYSPIAQSLFVSFEERSFGFVQGVRIIITSCTSLPFNSSRSEV